MCKQMCRYRTPLPRPHHNGNGHDDGDYGHVRARDDAHGRVRAHVRDDARLEHPPFQILLSNRLMQMFCHNQIP